MHFVPTSDQVDLQTAVRDVLARHCRLDVLRDESLAGSSADAAWKALAEMGMLRARLSPKRDGLGLDEVDLIGCLIETGRAGLPGPLVESAFVAAPLLEQIELENGSPLVGEALSALVDDGLAAVGGFVPSVDAQALIASLPGMLDGKAVTSHVLGADKASHLVMLATGRSGVAEVHVVRHADVEVRVGLSVDPTRSICEVRWEPTAATLVLSGAEATREATTAGERGALATAAQLLGLAQRVLTVTVEYAKVRHQFGHPIGSYQAVKHQLADVQVAIQFAEPACYQAAYSLAHGSSTVSADVAMAKALAGDAADLAARVGLQVHGALGYTQECSLHVLLRRIWPLSAAWGDARAHRARFLDLLLMEHRTGITEGTTQS